MSSQAKVMSGQVMTDKGLVTSGQDITVMSVQVMSDYVIAWSGQVRSRCGQNMYDQESSGQVRSGYIRSCKAIQVRSGLGQVVTDHVRSRLGQDR